MTFVGGFHRETEIKIYLQEFFRSLFHCNTETCWKFVCV